MKKYIPLFMLLLLVGSLKAQTITTSCEKFLKASHQENLDAEELLTNYEQNDFSAFWLEKDLKYLGFIGEDFQRFQIKFLSIVQNQANKSNYYVYGKTKVKGNICSFQGEIEILHIRKIEDPEKKELYEHAQKINDKELLARLKPKGVMLAQYTFYENKKEKASGVFNGIVKTNVFFENNTIYYDDLDLGYSDPYRNNQFVGTWKSYRSRKEKICNWGIARIPQSKDLDVGAGEFCPNKKYIENGWGNFVKAYLQQDENAKALEAKEWW